MPVKPPRRSKCPRDMSSSFELRVSPQPRSFHPPPLTLTVDRALKSAFAPIMSTLLEEQIGVIGLLQAMFPFESELVLSADTARFLDSDLADPPQSLDMTLSIRLDEEQSRVLEMNICLLTAVASGSDFQKIRISPRQPNWLTRTEFVNLAAAMTPLRGDEEPSDYILCMVDSIKEASQEILRRTQEQTLVEVAEEDVGDEALQRVWFWFPSLSTKEKRRDLVDYAPRYGLTGFVLAGEHIRTEDRMSKLTVSAHQVNPVCYASKAMPAKSINTCLP